jgi:hypothetical protein
MFRVNWINIASAPQLCSRKNANVIAISCMIEKFREELLKPLFKCLGTGGVDKLGIFHPPRILKIN